MTDVARLVVLCLDELGKARVAKTLWAASVFLEDPRMVFLAIARLSFVGCDEAVRLVEQARLTTAPLSHSVIIGTQVACETQFVISIILCLRTIGLLVAESAAIGVDSGWIAQTIAAQGFESPDAFAQSAEWVERVLSPVAR